MKGHAVNKTGESQRTMEYRNPQHATREPTRSFSRREVMVWASTLLIVLGAIAAVVIGGVRRATQHASVVKCGSNLSHIGRAVELYADDNGGQAPADFITLLSTMELPSEVLLCPGGPHERPSGPTTQAVVAAMLSGDHLGYAWVGGGPYTRARAKDVVLAFDLENHDVGGSLGKGINVLFGDSSVDFVDEPTAKAIRAQFFAGIRPVLRPTATRPATLPASTTGS